MVGFVLVCLRTFVVFLLLFGWGLCLFLTTADQTLSHAACERQSVGLGLYRMGGVLLCFSILHCNGIFSHYIAVLSDILAVFLSA